MKIKCKPLVTDIELAPPINGRKDEELVLETEEALPQHQLSREEIQQTRNILNALSARSSHPEEEIISLLHGREEEAPDRDREEEAKRLARVDDPEGEYVEPFLYNRVTMRALKDYMMDEDLLPDDTFSFLVTSKVQATPFILATLVFVFKFSIYAVTSLDVAGFDNPSNPFNIPASVSGAVRVSQLLSLLLSIFNFEDITHSLRIMRNGWSYEILRKEFPDVAHESNLALAARWYFSLLLRMSGGVFGLMLTFVLIMQSTTALDVLLNYAAMAFIGDIDNKVFALGRENYFGSQVRRHCSLVLLSENPDPGPVCPRRFSHLISLTFIYLVLFMCWLIIVAKQENGDYLCDTILVEFGDDVNPTLGAFSGLYDRVQENPRSFFTPRRSIYFERQSKIAAYSYCSEEKVWGFRYNLGYTMNEILDGAISEADFCQDLDAFSSEATTFNILETMENIRWFAKNQDERVVPLRELDLSMECYDCGSQTFGNCGSRGKCIEGKGCVCDDGWFGLTCQLRSPCDRMEIDVRGGEFESTRTWSKDFDLFALANESGKEEVLSLYGRPLYVHQYPSGRVDIIFFTGRRWALTLLGNIPGVSRISDLSKFVENFHAYYSNYTVDFLSESVDAAAGKAMPVDLGWFSAKDRSPTNSGMQAVDPQQPSEASLICSTCHNETNPCYFDEVCSPNGSCQCSSSASQGALCQKPPIGNGMCDPYYNTWEFRRDAGDCCEFECRSSDFKCGRDVSGYLEVGYFNCRPPNAEKEWAEFKGSMSSDMGAMSTNGAVLASTFAGPYGTEVRIFDRDGSQWDQRRRPLVVLPVFQGIESIAIGTHLTTAIANPMVRPPAVVVVGCPATKKAFVSKCETFGCSHVSSTVDAPSSMEAFRFGHSVDISNNGDRIAVASLGNFGSENGFVLVLEHNLSDTSEHFWNESLGGPVLSPSPLLLSMALSGNGEILAVASGDSSGFMSIQTYSWTGLSWKKVGSEIPGSFCLHEDNKYNRLVSLSSDGSTLGAVVGGAGSSVFDWSSDLGWVQQGSVLLPIANEDCRLDQTIRLSGDGKIVAVANTAAQEAFFEVFEWTDSEWKSAGKSDVKRSYNIRPTLSLTSFGDMLALSAGSVGIGSTGKLKVYELPLRRCGHMGLFHLSFVTTENTTWTLSENGTRVVLADGGDFIGHDSVSITEDICLERHVCAFLSINGTKQFKVYWNGNEIEVEESHRTSGWNIPVGNCSGSPS
ncbi:expressed unknown protein [Seminavis robusta]|uniref:EGF-like domain-containing protein n=1 Tax=Seminavis robusta TaxID=568900 RepID=A0A9N8E285_9STRA|nr:expressed unknown protein [Seminavis robusta]|eukprot:Sro579_g170030.1 n/a (1227) ;mRNA; f:44238-48093